MKKRFFAILTLAISLAICLGASVWADDNSGAIEISNAQDFIKISENLEGNYVLTDDIDLTESAFNTIGSSSNAFSGTLDGAGHTLTVELSATKDMSNIAVFAHLTGTVKNLKIKGAVEVNAKGGDYAVLAATVSDGAKIEFCENYADMTVTFGDKKTSVAAFAARLTSGDVSISNCINYGKISTKTTKAVDGSIGAVVGYTEDDTILSVERCANRAEITVDGGRCNIGGIVGQTTVGSAGTVANIELCCNTANINYYNQGGERAAGIIGYIKGGQINYCYNTGEIKAYNDNGSVPARNGYGSAFGIFGYANLTTASPLNCVGCFNASVDPLEAEICVIRNAQYGYFENFVMQDRSEYELELLASNVSSGESGTVFADAEELLALLTEKCTYFVKNENGGYPVFVWEQGGVLYAGEGDVGVYLTRRANPDNKDLYDMRFAFVVRDEFLSENDQIEFKINFTNGDTNAYEYTLLLDKNGGDLSEYSNIYANKVEYKAQEGCSIYVFTAAELEYDSWETLEVLAKLSSEYESLGSIGCDEVFSHKMLVTFEGLSEYRTENGIVSSEAYNCGTMIGEDSKKLVGDESYMYLINSTTEDEFEAYIDRLQNAGYELDQDRTIDSNRTCTLSKDSEDNYYVIHYVASRKQVQIIQENASNVLPSELSYDAPDNAVTPVLYQYSLNYTNSTIKYQDNRAINCGMLYIIKLPDNTLFVVDGGHGNQISDYSLNGIYDFMKQITGTKDGEKVQITGWFFTHAHGDHNGLAAAFLGYRYENTSTVSFQNKVDVKSVIFNYPSYVTMSSGYALTEVQAMKKAMRNCYPDIKTFKVHTGQRFTLAGVHFDVLFTHEDLVNPNGQTTVTNFNDTSTVIKVTFPNGQTYMQLGDIDRNGMNRFNPMYSTATMRSNIVQISHHAFNNLSELYSRINAPIALVPNSEHNAKNSQWNSFAPYTKTFYCADVYTYALSMKEKKTIDVEKYNHVG